MRICAKLILIAVWCSVSLVVEGQQNTQLNNQDDSLSKVQANRKKHYSAARKASIMSAVLPGLGQAVNKKYWKIPIIYAAFGGLAYMYDNNNNLYRFYRKNHIAETDDDSSTLNTTFYTASQLQEQKRFYQKNRNFAVIGIGLVYLLNIVDANVDAHLKSFDVSDDLSLQINPWFQPYHTSFNNRSAWGLSFNFKFKN